MSTRGGRSTEPIPIFGSGKTAFVVEHFNPRFPMGANSSKRTESGSGSGNGTGGQRDSPGLLEAGGERERAGQVSVLPFPFTAGIVVSKSPGPLAGGESDESRPEACSGQKVLLPATDAQLRGTWDVEMLLHPLPGLMSVVGPVSLVGVCLDYFGSVGRRQEGSSECWGSEGRRGKVS